MTRPLDFVLRWIDATGGLAEAAGPELFEVASAAPLAGFEGLSAVTGDIETAREQPGVELASPGSPLVDAVAREDRGAGRAARVFVVGLDAEHPGDPARAFRFGDAAVAVVSVRAYEHRLALFAFHLVFESDEREEDVVEVGVDLGNGRVLRRAAEAVLAASWSEERLEAWPLAPLIPIATAYESACEELRHRTSATVTARQAELERLFRAEAARIARYYDDLAEEIASARTERTPAEVAERVAATRRERERRVAELSDKYRLRVQASLATLLVAVQPKTHVALRVVPRKGAAAEMTVVWDPLLGAYEAADCPGCGRPGFEFVVAPGEGRVRCGLCPPAAVGRRR